MKRLQYKQGHQWKWLKHAYKAGPVETLNKEDALPIDAMEMAQAIMPEIEIRAGRFLTDK